MAEWTDVTDGSDLADRKLRRVSVDGVAVLLIRIEQDYLAVGNQCTHQGAPLDKGVVKIAGSVRTVTCPAHGSTFNLETGKVMRPPASKPVPVFDVKVEDGRVFVRPRPEG